MGLAVFDWVWDGRGGFVMVYFGDFYDPYYIYLYLVPSPRHLQYLVLCFEYAYWICD